MGTHLEIPQLADWETGWPVVRWDDDGIPYGVSLASYTVRSQVRPRPGALTLLHEWSTTEGNTRIETRTVKVWDLWHRQQYDIATDLAVLTVQPEDSADWTWRHGEWDLWVYGPEPDNWADPLDRGTISVIPAVTRP